MDSNAGLAIQSVGILLLTLLFQFMRSSIKSASLKYWTASWASLSVALLSLFVGLQFQPTQKVFYSIHFFGEYLFGLLFIAGCQSQVIGAQPTKRHVYLLVPAALIALVLPYSLRDLNDQLMIHAVIVAALFAAAYVTLRKGFKPEERSDGIRVMSAALLVLVVASLHYVPVSGARRGLLGITVPASYLQYVSVFDLLFEILLGFGTVMVLMEGVRREVELANRKLLEARDQLELLVQMDPLTEALNRHAFHSLLRRPENGEKAKTSGSVAVIDIDNLKPINDTFGHTVGDKAIRAVARAMRSLVRADDMLFRWGGDEFLVLMFNLPQEEASRRMEKLNEILAENCSRWTSVSISVTVSCGVAGFDSLTDLGKAIEAADKAMYARRNQARGRLTKAVEESLIEPVWATDQHGRH
ncbi:MAG TPA: GGDEF domain-containing protein [Pyrinomonadaceae bacterium]|nr:GGDEF domain-containing protein [Pyrinomonadaceae bacterium]